MTRQKVTISLEPELVQKIDEDRGLIPRSAYIGKLLKKSLANTQSNPPHKIRTNPDLSIEPSQPTPSRYIPDQTSPILSKPDQSRPTQATQRQPKPAQTSGDLNE